jgi:hypothetical protein
MEGLPRNWEDFDKLSLTVLGEGRREKGEVVTWRRELRVLKLTRTSTGSV